MNTQSLEVKITRNTSEVILSNATLSNVSITTSLQGPLKLAEDKLTRSTTADNFLSTLGPTPTNLTSPSLLVHPTTPLPIPRERTTPVTPNPMYIIFVKDLPCRGVCCRRAPYSGELILLAAISRLRMGCTYNCHIKYTPS